MEMHLAINKIVLGLIGHIAGPRIDGAYDKMFAWLRDPAFPLRMLPPYQGLSDEEARQARDAFQLHYAHVE